MQVVQENKKIRVTANLMGDVRKVWEFNDVGHIGETIARYVRMKEEVDANDLKYFNEEIGVLVSALKEFGINVIV